MHALVSGGAGFIGSHLVRELRRRGHEVTVVDNLSTGSVDNVRQLLDDDQFHFVEGDVCDTAMLKPLMQSADYCFHLAAAVGVKRIIEHPLASLEGLVHATSAVLDLANEHEVPVFFASTSEVYGKHDPCELHEDMPSIIGPVKHWRWLYACAKLLDEFWALAHHKQNGLPVIVARFFNVSGPRQTGQWGMVIPTFVKQAMQNEELTVYGDGEQKRCFMHVDDCIEAIMRLTENEAAVGCSVNIGNSHELSITELAERVIKLVPGSTSEVKYVSYHDAYGDGFEDMAQRKPDTSLLAELTGFRPQRPLDDIITDIRDYLTANGC